MNKTYCSHLQVFKENMGQKIIALLVFSQSGVFWCEMTQRIRSKVRGQCSIPCSSTAGSAGWGSAGCCPSPSCVSIAAFKRNKVWGNQQNHFFSKKNKNWCCLPLQQKFNQEISFRPTPKCESQLISKSMNENKIQVRVSIGMTKIFYSCIAQDHWAILEFISLPTLWWRLHTGEE